MKIDLPSPLREFLGKPELARIKNDGYREFCKVIEELSEQQRNELNDFIVKIQADYSQYNFDFYLRKSGNLVLGKRETDDYARGSRVLLIDVASGTFKLIGSSLAHPPNTSGTHALSDYSVVKRYFALNKFAIKRRTAKAKGRIPIDYAYFELDERDSINPDEPGSSGQIKTTGGLPEKIWRQINERRGGKQFRALMLKAFGNKCCISGCTDTAVLEAAHIVPHAAELNMSVNNGLLLRADIHTLYDLGLISVSATGKVEVAVTLHSKEYLSFNGSEISFGIGVDKQLFTDNIRKRSASYIQQK